MVRYVHFITAMTPEMLAYPFLFVSIFFEAFILVTLLSKPARSARTRAPSASVPTVAVIVPCYNEASTVAATCESLLALEYPKDKLEIILVDDGSTDATPAAMAPFAAHPQVRILRKENGGKHTALNAGIALTNADIVGCLDADSFVEPGALREIVKSFDNPKVAATTAAMSVHKPQNLLQHMQNAEYIFGITLRHALSSVNGLYVTPGPFSFYRRAIVEELGGFRHGHNTEDLEMALRLQNAGHWIDNAPRARVYTKAPRTVPALIKQRTRWTTGFMRNVLYEYRSLIGNRKFGALGTIVLPIGLAAIASGILLFGVFLFKLIHNAIVSYQIKSGIPLSYVFRLPSHGFDWFYLPTSLYLLLGAAVVLTTITFVLIGRRVSQTPANLTLGLFAYMFIYGLVVPLWLVRSTADVALGKRRSWR